MDLVKCSQPWLLPGRVRAVAAAPSRMCCPARLLGSQPLHGQPLAGPRVPSTQEECHALAAPAPAVSSARVPHLTLLWREQKGRDWMVESRGSGTAKVCQAPCSSHHPSSSLRNVPVSLSRGLQGAGAGPCRSPLGPCRENREPGTTASAHTGDKSCSPGRWSEVC